MRTRLWVVAAGVEGFLPLYVGAQAAGIRLGWLDLRPPPDLPPELEAAVESGALRGVSVGGGRSLALKGVRGQPVLDDLVREHFKGCWLVLIRVDAAGADVRGDLAALCRLEAKPPGWLLVDAVGERRSLSTEELLGALRKPGFG